MLTFVSAYVVPRPGKLTYLRDLWSDTQTILYFCCPLKGTPNTEIRFQISIFAGYELGQLILLCAVAPQTRV